MLRTMGTDTARALLCSSRCYSTRGVGVTPQNPRDDHPSPTASTAETHAAGPVPGQTNGPTSSPFIDLEVLRTRFRDWGILANSSLQRRTNELSKKATSTFSHLALHLNRVTGYEEIEALKRRVVEQEAHIKAMRRAAREAKTAYDDAVLQRSVSQRRVNDLLQRKSNWTDGDVGDFTSLVRSDHALEQEEARTKARVVETEDVVDREFVELMRVILARYHEEQIWSDKIRSTSTYGSLAVLGVNVVVFIMAIIVVEPWKRKRLAQTFEKKVEKMGAETMTVMNTGAARLEERLTAHEKLLTELVTKVSAEAQQGFFTMTTKDASLAETSDFPSSTPPWWSQVYFSYPHLSILRGRELILVAGSAAAGGVITLIAHSLFAR